MSCREDPCPAPRPSILQPSESSFQEGPPIIASGSTQAPS